MPMYEFECRGCGHKLEAMQKYEDKPLRTCPECKKRKLKKLISPSHFNLKGGGWYKGGFRGKQKAR